MLSEVSQDISKLATRDTALAVKTDRIEARVNQFIRVSPPASGQILVLPPPNRTELGDTVEVSVESPVGSLTVSTVPDRDATGRMVQGTINGQTRLVFSESGLIVFTSNGFNKWMTVTELGTSTTQTTSTTISTPFPSSPGLSVFGRAPSNLGPMAPITASIPRHVVRLSDDGTTLEWGYPVKIFGGGEADFGDFYLLNFSGGLGTEVDITDDGDGAVTIIYGWDETTNLVTDGDKGHIVVSSTGTVWNWDTTVAITGAQVISTTGDLTLTVGEDFFCNAAADVTINAGSTAGGVAIHAGLTPKTGANNNRVTISADDQVVLEPTGSLRLFTNAVERLEIENDGAWQLAGNSGTSGLPMICGGASAGPSWAVVGPTGIDLTAAYTWTNTHTHSAPVIFNSRVQGGTGSSGVFSTTLASGTTSNLAIGDVSCVRIAGPGGGAVMNLTGMVPGGDGQWVFIENTSATDILVLMHDVTSTAANRFYCTGLADMPISIRGGVWARYDNTLTRWVIAIPSYIGISSVTLAPTTHNTARALTFTEGAGINLTSSSASTGSAGVNVTIDVAMSQMAANTMKANATAALADPTDLAISANSFPARVGANLVSHPFSTLAGAGLDYAAGVIDVAVDVDHHIRINGNSDLIYRKSRNREFWHEECTFNASVAAGAAVTTSGLEMGLQSTNWWLVATTASGTWGPIASTNNHMGILRLTTSASDNSSVQMYNGVANTVGYDTYRGDEIYMYEAIIRLPTVTSILIVAGFQDNAATNTMMFIADTDTGSSNWHSLVTEGGVSTRTDTGTVMSANAWVVLTILQETVGTVDFYIDDVLEDTRSANIPDSETMGLLLAVFTRTTAARIMDVDYVSFESQDMGARTT
jgi:hypothetical protein